MLGLLLATVTVTVLATVAVAALSAVTVLPVFVALQMADARRFSTARWCGVAAVGVLLGLAWAWSLRSHHLLAAAPLLLTWTGPGLLWLLEPVQTRFGGRAGRHE